MSLLRISPSSASVKALLAERAASAPPVVPVAHRGGIGGGVFLAPPRKNAQPSTLAAAAARAGVPETRPSDGQDFPESGVCRAPPLAAPASVSVAGKPWKTADARLVLEDGSIWRAKSFGASGTQVGEVVFNTSLTGYQEILTDPSYAGQFVLMTNPHVGNTGVNHDDVDTRAITRRLREDGSLIGVLSTEESKTDEELLELSRKWKIVIAYDFGIKHNILRRLASCGCKITVVPSKWPASETLKMKPDGVLFGNGPGDPYAVQTVKELVGKVPIFGICMGHQLLGQALGGKTFKMKFGHHGGNHHVCNLQNGRVEISAQNHNYAVDPASLPAGVEVTHINLNDNSCAGLACRELNLMSLQYHLEASPSPRDLDPGNVPSFPSRNLCSTPHWASRRG
ncbi:hypothetical protein Taro_000819 [Colocasia esculenta]|uniref:carbamoyl-phosphate synthase (glutamine-hydrolyzing) n=1 Tax=Colocasia esculenta TaxID=4460 RepID=A0A843T9C5_COLES|nr:hypothetical protein [Colocasia esculenta]